jgi:pSer/pThr/pTyr-binding forkhead associated (FHA) protein
MNPAKITLTVARGSLEQNEYVFAEAARCTVGRARDCDIRVPERWENMDVSRWHCEFDIEPPTIWVRDLKSHNGTFVNGESIGQRPNGQPLENFEPGESVAFELKDGDEVRIGHNILRVGVEHSTMPADVQQVPMYFV